MLSDAVTTLLLAVAATTALSEGQHFAGMARVADMGFALVLAWHRAPLIMIILGAAAMMALLHFPGMP